MMGKQAGIIMRAILIVLVLTMGMAALADEYRERMEVTAEATAAVVVAPIVPDNAPTSAPVAVEVTSVAVNIVYVIGGLVAAFTAGGVVGVGGLALFIQRIRDDQVTRTAVEQLALSLPPSTLEGIREIIALVKDTAQLADHLTDGDPAT